MAKLYALQMISSPDVEKNLQQLAKLLSKQIFEPDSLVVLPECVACFGGADKTQLQIAEPLGKGPIQDTFAQLAKKHQIYLVAGTIPIQSDNPNKFTASCLIYDPNGQRLAEYQKIHLFDVQVADNTGQYQESRYTKAGESICVLDLPFGRVGVAVCYDLRFAGLFQAMDDLDLLVLPSAFTEKTGKAHWYPLLAARAIEKQCYLVAANQGGEHANGRQTYGHSCIFSPWGEELVKFDYGSAIIGANLDPALLAKVKANMPVSQHNRFRSHFVESR